MPDHLTVFQLLETYHSIVKCIDEDKSSCIIFVTFQIQINGVTVNHFWSGLEVIYLTDIKRSCTKYFLSSSKNTSRVCTWHLTFFSFMWLIFPEKKLKAMCMTYADDNSLQYSLNNIAEIQCCINQDLKFYICGQNRGYSR